MSEFFQWLSNNPLAATVVTISFVIFTLTFVFAVVQGREISMWPPKIGSKLVEQQKEIKSGSLPISTGDTTLVKNSPSILYLFGYFCTEKDGLEKKILISNNLSYSPFVQGEVSGDIASLEEAIDRLVLNFIEAHGISKHELLEAGISKPTYQRLFEKVNDTVQQTPYVFFKIRVQKEFPGAGCEWNRKEIVIASWLDEHQMFPLQLPHAQEIGKVFRKDYIIQQLGLKILECVDVLVFRENKNHQIEFLLIHRNRPDEIKVSSKDTWEYPKGGIRYYETYVEAVYREVQEESSITPEEVVLGSYLGWQTVDVSRRKKPYGIIRVHGYTLWYKGNPDKKLFSGEGHDGFKWVPLDQAQKEIWMEENHYGAEFLERWKSNEEEILRNVGIKHS